jgi:beta-mannosidase
MGPTALPTVRACMPQGQQRVNSFAWQMHDNGIAQWGDTRHTDNQTIQWLGKDIAKLSLEEYVYWAGVLQGEGIAEYVRNFRRRMFNCSSAIFWMYNDCWPVVRSWTIVDYYLRRTPAFHPVRRAFQPLSVAVVHENGKVQVYGVNEGSAWQGQLRCGLFALAGGYPLDMHQEVAIPANTSTRLAEFPAEEWTRLGEKTHAAFAILSQDGEETAQDSLFLPFYKEMEWPKAEVRVQRKHGKAIFESDAFAWRVCLDLDGEIALPDNFFDILPGIPKVLDWPEALGEPKILRTGNL